MTRKLLVIPVGTVAAGLGLEILKQVKEHPASRLDAIVRYIDTAYLPSRYSELTTGEWFQLRIDPRHLDAIYKNTSSFPRLIRMLYPNLLPMTGNTGSGSIRYNAAVAMEIQRDALIKWLSSGMTDLVLRGSGEINLSVALVVSAVGGTGSGLLERLIEVVVDAAQFAGIPEPLRCDAFILQPGQDVTDLGLANTLALYAEMASSRLSLPTGNIRYYQGRKIMVGWGSSRALASIEQLKEAAATLVRLTFDPVTDLAAEFRERAVDNHVLLELDPISSLPTHLSTATAVTISLGNLEEQIIHRDNNRLLEEFAFGQTASVSRKDVLLGKLEDVLGGKDAFVSYRHLLDYLSEDIALESMETHLDATLGDKKLSINEKTSRLVSFWQQYKEEIRRGVPRIERRGEVFVADAIRQLGSTQRKLICEGSLSVSELREEYQSFQGRLKAVLAVPRADTLTTPEDESVRRQEAEVNAQGPLRLFNKETKLRRLASAIKDNLREHIYQRSRIIAIQALEGLEDYCAQQERNLEIALVRLRRQLDSDRGWNAAHRQLGIETGHPLYIAALSSTEEVNRYADLVSIFASRSAGGNDDKRAGLQDRAPLAEFYQRLETGGELNALFKGDTEPLSIAVKGYISRKIQDGMGKYSIVDLLMQIGGEALLQRFREAAGLANTMVSYSQSFAYSRREAWYVSAYYRNEEQRSRLYRLIDQAFPQGQCKLTSSRDPSEIAVFYYVDGLAMSAVDDLKGRCLEAFLRRRLDWLRQQQISSNDNSSATSPDSTNQRVGVPVYSGRDAEKRVLDTGVIKHIYQVKGVEVGDYEDIPKLSGGYESINITRKEVSLPPSSSMSDQEYEVDREEESQETGELPIALFTSTRVFLEEGNRALVDKTYSLQAGISREESERVDGEALDLRVERSDETLLFDISLHASDNIQISEWYQPLLYDLGNPEPQFVEFTFQVKRPGTSLLVIDFYHQRRWLKTARFEFDAVEKSHVTTVS